MSRSVWTAAGDELINFNKYLDQQGAEQQRRAQYSAMVDLRRKKIEQDLARAEQQAMQDKLDNEYRQNKMELEKQNAEFLKQQNEAKALIEQQKADARSERLLAKKNLGDWYTNRMAGQGTEEGWTAPTKDELMVAGFQNNVHPDDFRTYQQMLFRDNAKSKDDWTWKQKYDYQLANPKPNVPTPPKPTSGMIEGRAVTPRGAANMQGSLAYHRSRIPNMTRNVMGQEDSRWSSTNTTINKLTEDYNNYSQFNADPILIDQMVINKRLDELKAENGEGWEPTENDFRQIAWEIVEAKRRTQGR